MINLNKGRVLPPTASQRRLLDAIRARTDKGECVNAKTVAFDLGISEPSALNRIRRFKDAGLLRDRGLECAT